MAALFAVLQQVALPSSIRSSICIPLNAAENFLLECGIVHAASRARFMRTSQNADFVVVVLSWNVLDFVSRRANAPRSIFSGQFLKAEQD